jgi:hypothetical protein
MIAKTAAGVPFNYVRGATPTRWFTDNFSDCPRSNKGITNFISSRMQRAEFLERCFPVKKHSAAVNKINVHLPGLVGSLVKLGHANTVKHLIYLLAGKVAEDVFINCVIYGYGLRNTFGDQGWDIAVYYTLNPKVAKNVSVALKALGANTSREGALLVEADVLQGRLAGPLSLDDEIDYRCRDEAVANKTINKAEELREHVKAIVEAELAGKVTELPDLHNWWSSRWLWCVNGSNNADSSRALGLDPKRDRATHTRDYRRMAAEAVEHEPLTSWDGTTYVSASIKLENGKQRAIFACDTRSYFGFSWLFGAVEKAWANSRVILNPGVGGHIGISRRIRNSQKGGGVNLMLDYDDFNSHHSSDTMKMVTEVLADRFGAPPWYKKVLMDSFDKEYIKHKGEWRRIVGTLMSGHRGTTMFNSILNAAYVRAAVGGAYFDSLRSLHAGDDVYIRCNTLSDCERILYGCKEFGCRMNPTKQSIGFVGAEFLRVAVGKTASFGYYARAVAGFVSGNWVTFDPLKPLEGLTSAISGCRNLINRSGCQSLAELLAPALRFVRGYGIRKIIALLSGNAALVGAPVFNTDGWIRNYKAVEPKVDTLSLPSHWSRNATRDYLTDHLSDVEITALSLVGVDAVPLLVASSYSKGLNKSVSQPHVKPVLRALKPRLARGFVGATDLLDDRAERGVLASYPVLRLLENRLSDDDLRFLVRLAGGDHTQKDIRATAFGRESSSKNIIGFLSYGDAASLSKRTTSDNIYVLHHVYV